MIEASVWWVLVKADSKQNGTGDLLFNFYQSRFSAPHISRTVQLIKLKFFVDSYTIKFYIQKQYQLYWSIPWYDMDFTKAAQIIFFTILTVHISEFKTDTNRKFHYRRISVRSLYSKNFSFFERSIRPGYFAQKRFFHQKPDFRHRFPRLIASKFLPVLSSLKESTEIHIMTYKN